MSQSQTRQQIAEHLTWQGPLEDTNGRATAKLMEAVGYEGSLANFAQLISNMDRSGQLTRDVRGKRTYRIAAAANDLSSTADRAAQGARDGGNGLRQGGFRLADPGCTEPHQGTARSRE